MAHVDDPKHHTLVLRECRLRPQWAATQGSSPPHLLPPHSPRRTLPHMCVQPLCGRRRKSPNTRAATGVHTYTATRTPPSHPHAAETETDALWHAALCTRLETCTHLERRHDEPSVSTVPHAHPKATCTCRRGPPLTLSSACCRRGCMLAASELHHTVGMPSPTSMWASSITSTGSRDGRAGAAPPPPVCWLRRSPSVTASSMPYTLSHM